MSSILLFWLGVSVGFIVVEFITATFYGLSLALAAGIVALYVFIAGDSTSQILQAFIFMLSSAIFAFFLPRYLVSRTPSIQQGMEKYLGEKKYVKKIGSDMKISLDGVDYLIISDDKSIVEDDLVRVIGFHGVSMKVNKVVKPQA